ncbi:MAG: hypothetical protein MUF54_15765, partial [Polyangiaceae bacterium]|nr:hypothetical protein [Polyangiaceae bacterium]
MSVLSLLDLIVAARCPRQLALQRVHGASLVDGSVLAAHAVHDAMAHVTLHAPKSTALLETLREAAPNRDAVSASVYCLAYGKLHDDLVKIARRLDADDMMQADAVLRSATNQMGQLLAKARTVTTGPQEAIQATCSARDETIRIRLDEGHIEDQVGPVQRDATTGDVWWWDLSRHAGTHRAQLVHLKALTIAFGHRNHALVVGLYPVQGEEAFVVRTVQRIQDDVAQLRSYLAD